MKNFTRIVLGLAILCGAALAQQKGKGSGYEAALRALEAQWDAATLKADTAALGQIFGDTFVSTDSSGVVRTKVEVLARLRSGAVKYEAAKADDLRVFLYGDSAVVTGRWTGKGVDGGKAFDTVERFTDVFVKQNGQWKAMATHASTIKR